MALKNKKIHKLNKYETKANKLEKWGYLVIILFFTSAIIITMITEKVYVKFLIVIMEIMFMIILQIKHKTTMLYLEDFSSMVNSLFEAEEEVKSEIKNIP